MKKNSKYLIRDLIFTFVCLLVISGTSYSLYQDITERIDFSKNQQVGHIVFKRNSAHRKYASYSVWEHLNQKSPLYNKDTIRTSKDSDVRLVLEGGIEVALEQQSLIFVIMTPRGFEIDFQGGEIHSIAVNRMTVRYRNSTITLEKGTSFSLCELDNNSAELTVNRGNAHIENSGSGIIKNVTGNEKATITSNSVQITALQFKDCFPPNNTILVSPDKKMSVNFTWKTEVPETTVIVARDVQLNDIVTTADNAKGCNIELSPGRYYWKLVSSSTESRTFSFEVLEEKTPLITTPVNNSNLEKSGKDSFEVSWLTRGRADSYMAGIYPDGSDTPIESATTKNNSTMLTTPADGTYQVIVTPIYLFGAVKTRMNSEAVTVHVNSSFEKAPVNILAPAEHTTISLKAAINNGILCSWGSTHDKCRVELFSENESTDNSADPIISEETIQNSIRLTGSFKPGNYTIRVTPLAGSYDKGETRFQLKEGLGLTLISPGENSHFKAGNDILFTWKDQSAALNYQLQISKDSSFKNIITKQKISVFSSTLSLAEPGIYFARVNTLDPSDKTAVLGNIRRFSIPRDLPSPSFNEKNMPADIDTIVTPSIEVSWNSIPGADRYQASLLKSGNAMSETLISTITTSSTSTSFSNTGRLTPGRYCIKITALKKEQELLIATSDEARHYFNASRGRGLEIKTPETIFILVK